MSLNSILSENDSVLYCGRMVCSNGITGNCLHNCDNVGTGSEVFKQTVGSDINRIAEFRTLTAGTNITLTQNTDDIVIDAAGTGSIQLSDCTDVQFSPLVNNDYLRYNQSITKWVNSPFPQIPQGYLNVYELDSTTVNATAYSIYRCNNVLINMYYNYNVGEKVFVYSVGPGQTAVKFPGGLNGLLNGQLVTTDILLNHPGPGCIEFTNVGQLSWVVSTQYNNWFNGATPLIPWNGNINQLFGVSTTGIVNNQILRYNGTNFVSSDDVRSFNSRNGAVLPQSGDYSISQITNSSTLADSNNINISSALDNQVLTYNTSSSKWINSYSPIYYTMNYSILSQNINPAVANTHYSFSNGGNVTIAPLNAGDHIMVTAVANAITVNFTGTSFVTNSFLGGGTSNPTFNLLFTTLELNCVFNSGQTYYHITRVSQNNDSSICTLNGVKISAINNINNIPNVNISSVANNNVLAYDTITTKWINQMPVNYFMLNSSGNIAANQFFQYNAMNGTETAAQLIVPIGVTSIFNLSVGINTPMVSGNLTHTFTVRVNGANTALVINFNVGNTYLTNIINNISIVPGDKISIQYTRTGAGTNPPNTAAYVSFVMK